MSFDREDPTFKVLVDAAGRYTIWADYKQTPPGFRPAGMVGTKQDCLAYIECVCPDMRPISDDCA